MHRERARDVQGAAKQCRIRFRREKTAMCGKCNILHPNQRMILRQGLVRINIQSGMAQMAVLQSAQHRRLIHQRAARSVDQNRARAHGADPRCVQKPARFLGQQQMQGNHVAFGKQHVQRHERHPCKGFGAAVPGQNPHAAAQSQARHLRGNAAEADQAQRLARQLHAGHAQPFPAAHGLVHARNSPRGGPHQGNGVFGHRCIAIAFDGMHTNPVRSEGFGVHVTARAGAEKNDMLQPRAGDEHSQRKGGVVHQRELIAGEQSGQILRRHPRLPIHPNRRVVGFAHLNKNSRHLLIRIQKHPAHATLLSLRRILPIRKTPRNAPPAPGRA